MTTQEKITALAQIAAEIKSFKGLDIAKAATNAVPGEGDPDSEIMFIGEAPGMNEDKTGRPFVGLAGKLLEQTLKESLHLNRDQVYITNIVKFRPPENRDPIPNEIEVCKVWLDKQISIIAPKYIATLGRFSMGKFIPDVTISRVHGQSHIVNWPSFIDPKVTFPITIFPMFHPAAALRAPEMMKHFKDDFNKLNNILSTQLKTQIQPELSKIRQDQLDLEL